MHSNIIERLEAIADNYKNGNNELMYSDYEAICQAWSEIELLRENNDYLKSIINTLKKEAKILESNLESYKGRY